MKSRVFDKIEFVLKTTGLVALGLGVLLGFCDLKGWLVDKDKAAILEWVLTSPKGLSIEHPGAQKFMKAFPSPAGSRPGDITHLTKHVIRLENGPVQNASINYMHRDGTRTAYVATLDEVRGWSVKTSYPFWAWLLSLIGFFEMAGAFFLERVRKKREAIP